MPYLDIPVESILAQTFQNFEFVILDAWARCSFHR